MWFALALTAALTQAVQFAFVKARARHVPPIVLVFWTQTLGLLGWAVYFVATGTRFVLPPGLWAWVLAAVALSGTMAYCLARASARGDISIVGPMVALSPVFAIVPDWVISGTLPSLMGWVGLGLAVSGTATLSGSQSRGVGLAAFFRREDAGLGLTAAVTLGLLAAVDRHNALQAGVPCYLLAIHGITAGLALSLSALRHPDGLTDTLEPRQFAVVAGYAGLVVAGTALLTVAITLAPAAYVSAVRRLSSVFSVVLGRALFAESGLAGRLAGAILTTAGTLCLLLAG